MKKNCLILNQGYTDNIGDQLICEMLTRLVEDAYNVESTNFIPFLEPVTIQEAIRKRTSKEHISIAKKIILVGENTIRKIVTPYIYDYFRAMHRIRKEYSSKHYDLIIIGGGELLKSDHIFLPCLDAWTSFFYKQKARISLFGVSSDMTFTDYEKQKLNAVFKRFSYINVRDKSTVSVLNRDFKVQASYSPDCVFSYTSCFRDQPLKEDHVLVMVFDYWSLPSPRKWATIDEYFSYWWNIVIEACQGNTKRVRFSYTTAEDAECTQQFYQKYSQAFSGAPNLNVNYGKEQIISDIAKAKVIVTGRMHAMILAKQYNTKIVPFCFKRKIDDFVETWLDKKFDLELVTKEIHREVQNMICC